MALDAAEGIAAAFRELPIFDAVQSAVEAMPPITPERPRLAIDFAPVVGVKPGTIIYMALQEFNDPVHHPSDLVDILQLDAHGPLAQQLLAIDLLIADIAD